MGARAANLVWSKSSKIMPLDDEMITDLLRWRSETPYAGDQDWIFASGRMKGRQPLWPEAIERNYIRPAAKRAKITKDLLARISLHIFYASCRE
jgi:integrase